MTDLNKLTNEVGDALSIDKFKKNENVIKMIESGCNWREIEKTYGLSYSSIGKIAKKFNLLDKFKQNNNKTNPRLSGDEHPRRKSSILRYEAFNLEWGKIIESEIENGANLSLLIKKTGAKLTFLRRFIQWKGDKWKQKLSVNSEIIIKKNAFDNLKKIEKLSNHSVKKIEDKHIKLYKKMLEQNKTKSQIVKTFVKKYNFGHKKVEDLAGLYGKPNKQKQSGKNNPMYGKSPSIKAGIGTKGWVINKKGEKIFFRSSLEMKVFLFLIENNVEFLLSKHRINYKLNKKERTYCPDIVIGNVIYEIKPKQMVSLKENQIKFKALENYCKRFNLKCGFYTEEDFDYVLDAEKIEKLILEDKIILDKKNKEKILRNL